MKKCLFPAILSFLAFLPNVSTAQASTIIYVNHAATGANNGTSWANAFIKLQPALNAASSNAQIWVAAGTYSPDGLPANNSFAAFDRAFKLYGGFEGTETALSQRNPAVNLSILSGDIAGDDIPGDFTQKRADNARHVLHLLGDPQFTVVVDGFTFRGGQGLLGQNDPDLERRGGGILAQVPVVVRNCRFTDNQASSGAGLACLEAGASGSRVENCIFEGNDATAQSAGVLFRGLTSGEVKKCIFRNNTTNRGCFYPVSCKTIVVDSCLFENNNAGNSNFGGGMFSWQSSFVLKNSIFRGNKAANAAGIYNDHREGGNFFSIENCLFENNEATDYGGAGIYNWVANCEIKNCQFKGNKSPNTAAAMYNSGGADVRVFDCVFENGTANFGAGAANYGAGTKARYENCTFKDNTAATSGGAMINGFLANVTLKNCLFNANGARWGGGIYNQNDSTSLSVEACVFSGNSADNYGGGINVDGGIALNIGQSTFVLNTANFGGAIAVAEDSLDLTILNVENSFFSDNFANTQAAGINISNSDVELKNCLFHTNYNVGTGAGGAISNNASEGKTSELVATNCTFANNTAPIGAGIAQWQDDTSSAYLTLQNCILANIGSNYDIEAGQPQVFSNGGNLVSDATLEANLGLPNDRHNADPEFTDPSNFIFELKLSSPGIDNGTAAGAPPTDMLGNPRINEPDAGCFENQAVVRVSNAPLAAMTLQLSPNPASDFVGGFLENEFRGSLVLEIRAANGQLLQRLDFEKQQDRFDFRADVAALPAGQYFLKIRQPGGVAVGQFLKI